MDSAGQLRADVYDVSISTDARWAFVGCGNGFVVVELHGANGDPSFDVVDTFYTVWTSQVPNPFGNGQFYGKVEGIAQTGNHLFVSVIGGPNDPSPGLLAWFGSIRLQERWENVSAPSRAGSDPFSTCRSGRAVPCESSK